MVVKMNPVVFILTKAVNYIKRQRQIGSQLLASEFPVKSTKDSLPVSITKGVGNFRKQIRSGSTGLVFKCWRGRKF